MSEELSDRGIGRGEGFWAGLIVGAALAGIVGPWWLLAFLITVTIVAKIIDVMTCRPSSSRNL